MSGPPRKPSAIRKLEGRESKPSEVRNEPRPTAGAPAPPGDLTPEARAEWARMVPELERMGLVARIDRAALVVYCEAWSAFDDARQSLAEHGPLIEGQKGNLVRNPAAQLMRDAADLMLKYGSRFGFTPSDRTRLEAPTGDSDGPDAQVLALLS